MLKKNKKTWIIAAAVVLFLGAGFAYYQINSSTAAAQAASTAQAAAQTAVVRRGNLEVTASGSGSLISGNTKNLSFPVSGTVANVDVVVGDTVKEGDALAELDELDQLQADVASAKVDLLTAQKELQDLYDNADVTLADAYADYVSAKDTYADAQVSLKRKDYARCSQDVNTLYYDELLKWQDRLDEADKGSDEYVDIKAEYDTALANYNYCIAYTDDEILSSQADYEVAQANFNIAESKYNALKAASGVDPDDVTIAEAQVASAELALEIAQENLDGASMTSPINGTVISIAGDAGEAVDTSTFISVADLQDLYIQVYVDETDMDKLKVGNSATITFDAVEDKTFNGTVIQVSPELVKYGNTDAVEGLIALDLSNLAEGQKLALGLNASVEIVSGSVQNALLVSLEALHDQGNGAYVVYVMENGQPVERAVEVGLQDLTYAEILSGLEQGETVYLGNVENLQ